jgi:hypothetical protein
MSTQSGVLAVYKYLDDLTHAMEKVRSKAGFEDYEVFSPTSYHEIEHAAGYTDSPVKWFTLTGALTGMFTGFGLCLATDYDWPLVVGGKTAGIYSLPAYVVIGFELAILLGAICTIAGMLVCCKIPNPKTQILDTRFTDDRFGIFVPNVGTDSEQAKMLRELGAEEIHAVKGA